MTFLTGERGVRFLAEFFGHDGHVTKLPSSHRVLWSCFEAVL
jgi:hypothetical protein